MRKVVVSLLYGAIACAVCACSTHNTTRHEPNRNMQPRTHEASQTKKDLAANDTANPVSTPPAAPEPAKNNTYASGSPTPMDQGENKTDLAITQAIRRSLMKDDMLSTTAKNVKVITADGVVTLRGPVNTPEEKQTIQDKAMQVAGVLRVDNQLDVASR